jgi:hypothetical protein
MGPPAVLFMGTGLECSPMAVSAEPAAVLVTPRMTREPAAIWVPPGSGPPMPVRGELQIGSGPFDPVDDDIWPQLAEILDVGEYSTIEEMEGFHGGLNEGIWFLESGKEKLVLKLVKAERTDPTVLTDAENCLRLMQEHPGILIDPVLAFPRWILACREAAAPPPSGDGQRRYDLLVMRKVPGRGLAEVVATKRLANQIPEVLLLLERLGALLRDFHDRYGGSQHGDFHSGNIFYDEESDAFAFIDVGGIGIPTMDSDVDHFSKALRYFSEAYGHEFVEEGLQSFELGYHRGNRRNLLQDEEPNNGLL